MPVQRLSAGVAPPSIITSTMRQTDLVTGRHYAMREKVTPGTPVFKVKLLKKTSSAAGGQRLAFEVPHRVQQIESEAHADRSMIEIAPVIRSPLCPWG